MDNDKTSSHGTEGQGTGLPPAALRGIMAELLSSDSYQQAVDKLAAMPLSDELKAVIAEELRRRATFQPAHVPQAPSPPKKERRRLSPAMIASIIFICVVAFFLIGSAVANYRSPASSVPEEAAVIYSSAPPPAPTPAPTPEYPIQTRPAIGYTKKYHGNECIAPLEFILPNDDLYYYIILRKHGYDNAPAFSLFLYPNESREILVPLGSYDIYVACGTTWYGFEHVFGSDGGYSQLDDVFEFYVDGDYVMGNTITLHTVYGGNLDSTPLDMEEFLNPGSI